MNARLFHLIHTERNYRRYFYQPLNSRLNPSFLRILVYEIRQYANILTQAIKMAFPPQNKQLIFVNGRGRKSTFRILAENLIWAIKYKEVCNNYFIYGMDIKGVNPGDYISYTEFRVIRNILNIRQRENLPTGYTFNYLSLVRDKFVFYQYCKSLGMPIPKTIALINKESISWYDKGNMEWQDISTIIDRDLMAFCKETTGEGGKGAFVLEIRKGKIYISGEESDLADIKRRIGGSKYILQEKIENHHLIKAIYPNSLNTLRLHTFVNPDGTVELFSAVHRFGANGSIVDNGCAGGMLVGVNENGILDNKGYFEPNKGKEDLVIENNHPNTFCQFAGIRLPYWDEILKTSFVFHKFMYGIPSIGWDIAITENGFVFTEAGEDWEIGFDQIANGPQKEHFYKTHGYALNIKLRKY